MGRLRRALGCAAIALAVQDIGAAEQDPLTLERALALARERAPAVLSALGRIEEAQGRLTGASAVFSENPVLDGGYGRREVPDSTTSTVESRWGLSQAFELGGQRRARIAGAEAGLSRASAGAAEETRRLLRDTAVAFCLVLHAEERLRLATASQAVAAEIHRISVRRHLARDIPRLEENLARAALSRAASEISAVESVKESALGRLRRLLGMTSEEELSVSGDLRNRKRFELGELLARAPARPDLVSLESEVREAEAGYRLGAGQRWPDLTLGAAYERESDARIGLGVLSFTLPLFDRGQGLRAESRARARRSQGELEAGRRSVAIEVRTAFNVYRHRVEAVEELESNGLPLVEESETMASRSYEVGQSSLTELLVVRREFLATRIDYADRLLEAAVAGFELEASAGVLQ